MALTDHLGDEPATSFEVRRHRRKGMIPGYLLEDRRRNLDPPERHHLSQAGAGIERLVETLSEQPTVREPVPAKSVKTFQSQISLENVSFSYGNQLVLRDINLKIPRGFKLGVAGESGSGKSTLVNLLFRFYDPTSGAIKIDGADLREVSVTDLRQQMALVSQEIVLFNKSVAENIESGKLGASRAEIEAVQSRQALAHVGRVSTIGELTASLAHQLSQPLTGILSNAQAARRLLDRMPPDYTELRAATSDIVEDARRAGEVVQKLRELLRRGELKMIPIDVSAVLRDIVHLITSDAIIRRITLALEIDNHPLMVLGDRVQLQQVLLNLIVNALEAIDEHADQRIVRVYCQRTIEQRIRIMVSDSGAGLPAGSEDLVFDPFYTTKPDGMGIGLSVSRSIVESHHGRLWVVPNDGPGVTFAFSIPIARRDHAADTTSEPIGARETRGMARPSTADTKV